MKLAITGSTGFVGAHVKAVALARGHHVVCPVRRILPSPDFWRDLVGCDAVCHLAAHIPIHMADRHPETFQDCFVTNVLLTARILRAAQIAGVPRFVNFSSGNAYAVKQDYPGEGAPLYPSSRGTAYLASKVAQEIVVSSWHELATCSLRLGSVYGPGQIKGMLPHLIRRLLRGDTVVLENGGTYGADYVSVHDVARVAVDACESDCTGPFNIGSGRRVTIKTMAEVLRGIIGSKSEIIVKPLRNGNIYNGFPALNISRAIRELGFACQILQPGLTQYVEWLNGETHARQDASHPADRAPDLPAAGEHRGAVLSRP